MILNPKKIIDEKFIVPAAGTKVQQCGIDLTIAAGEFIPAHGFRNVEFAESIKIPENAAAILCVRSSLSRKGIFISSGVYDPGFSGKSGCSIYNMGDEPCHFDAGDRIAQIVFFECDAASAYNGKYQGSNSAESLGWK